VPVPGKAKSRLICRAFEMGAPRSAEGYVFFGTEGVLSQFHKARAGAKPWWYVDNSYADKHRGIYFRVTKNGLQVDPRGRTSDGKRWAKLDIEIKPWRTHLGNDILVVPQSELFMKSTTSIRDWTADTVKLLKSFDLPFPIRVRPWNSDKFKQAAKLAEDLPNLRLLVTWSSASAITAMLEGVPAISMSPDSAAHWLTGPLTRESVESPPRPDGRLEFAQVLADNMFALEEFRDGTAWRMLEKQG
jgi:hypothetical protein